MSRLPMLRKLSSIFKPVPMACVDAAFFHSVGQPALIDHGLNGVPNRESAASDRNAASPGVVGPTVRD